MNPDVAEAIPELVRHGFLPGDRAAVGLRIARDELVSLRLEIRLLFCFGVLLTSAGVGLLAEQNYQRIGPPAMAAALGVSVVALLGRAACRVRRKRRDSS